MVSLAPIPEKETPVRRASSPCRLSAAFAGALVLVSGLGANGQNKPSEYDVKAAYLFDFGKFIRLSSNPAPRPTFDICVVGQDAMGPALDSVAENEEIDHRAVHVRRLKEAAEARTCDVAYISASEGEHVEADLAQLRGADVLTVSDAPRFLARGGMIQFLLVANHVRFAVSLKSLKHSHLALTSELLRVAVSVSGAPEEVAP